MRGHRSYFRSFFSESGDNFLPHLGDFSLLMASRSVDLDPSALRIGFNRSALRDSFFRAYFFDGPYFGCWGSEMNAQIPYASGFGRRLLLISKGNLQDLQMAEWGGFEPPVPVSQYNGLASHRLQPLGHHSTKGVGGSSASS